MKVLISILLFFLIRITVFATVVRVELTGEDKLEHFISIDVFDANGVLVSNDLYQSESFSVNLPDSIIGEVLIIIKEIGYFPIEIGYVVDPNVGLIIISNIRLIPSLRRKLPKNATCGTYAPRKKDIPKKMDIVINGVNTRFVPDSQSVIGITYIEKKK